MRSLFQSFDLVQTINVFTRITDGTKSCIDNIFTILSNYVTEIIETHVSDHSSQIIRFAVDTNYKRFFLANKSNFSNTLKGED